MHLLFGLLHPLYYLFCPNTPLIRTPSPTLLPFLSECTSYSDSFTHSTTFSVRIHRLFGLLFPFRLLFCPNAPLIRTPVSLTTASLSECTSYSDSFTHSTTSSVRMHLLFGLLFSSRLLFCPNTPLIRTPVPLTTASLSECTSYSDSFTLSTTFSVRMHLLFGLPFLFRLLFCPNTPLIRTPSPSLLPLLSESKNAILIMYKIDDKECVIRILHSIILG